MTPFLLFLRERLAQLTPLLRREVKMRIALHRHPGVAGVVEAAVEILQAIPGIELVDLQQPAVGLQSNNLRVLPAFKRELQRNELQAASDAGVDALVASIIPIIANYARTNATGRSASSMCSKSSARAWACTATTATRSSS